MITETHDKFKCSIHHWCYMIWWFWECHILVFLLLLHFFFFVCFTTNRAMMSNWTITCREIYVLWCCFHSVHRIVLYRVLDWINYRGKGLTWSNKEQRASFLFGFRERERLVIFFFWNLDWISFHNEKRVQQGDKRKHSGKLSTYSESGTIQLT